MCPEKKVHRILIIEDSDDNRMNLHASFERYGSGARLEFVSSPEAGFDVLKRETVDAIVVNHALAGNAGLEFLREFRKTRHEAPVILLTSADDHATALKALRDGIDECVDDDIRSFDAFPPLVERVIARNEAIREKNKRTRAIIRGQKQWMAILDAITDYIFVLDDQQRLVRVNQAFATAFGMHPKDIVGRQCLDLFGTVIGSDNHPDDGTPGTCERKIGDATYQISMFPLQEGDRGLTIHVMKNITEVKKLKDQLYNADKLASIGLLVSGVAHEINNPLTGVIAYSELIAMKTTDENVRADLKKVLDSAERCKKIVDNLLTFSRQNAPSKSLESVNDIIDRAIDLRNYWLKSGNVEVVKDYAAITTVFVDAQQIQQVIHNLLLNAEQSIVAAGVKHGKISFSTRFDRDAGAVFISIKDNGQGIPQEIMPRIFDPFFSTKRAGARTGLGLSISHGIITEHGGTILAENASDGGAIFIIKLPTGTGALKAASDFKESRQLP